MDITPRGPCGPLTLLVWLNVFIPGTENTYWLLGNHIYLGKIKKDKRGEGLFFGRGGQKIVILLKIHPPPSVSRGGGVKGCTFSSNYLLYFVCLSIFLIFYIISSDRKFSGEMRRVHDEHSTLSLFDTRPFVATGATRYVSRRRPCLDPFGFTIANHRTSRRSYRFRLTQKKYCEFYFLWFWFKKNIYQ